MTTILVIEDEPAVLDNIQEILEFEGFKTARAEDGLTGVRLARELRPDLILCDIMMPELDGYGVLSELRSDSETATIPFIFLTALETRDDMRRGMAMGADDYITKPFSSAELLDSVQARLAKQQIHRQARLEALSRRLVEAQEAERQRIARELHGEIGQLLTGVQMTLGLSKRLASEPVRARLDEGLALINEILRRVNEMSSDLHPAVLDDLGLLPALHQFIKRFSDQNHVHVTLQQTGMERRLAPEVEIAAFRIIQEALSNVARHTTVTEATVQLWVDDGVLGIVVEDDGEGFDLETVLGSGQAAGLTHMHERARALGGELSLFSAPGEGTRVVTRLPAHKSEVALTGPQRDAQPAATKQPPIPTASQPTGISPPHAAGFRVLVAEPNDLLRQGLCRVIDTDPALITVGEASTFKQVIDQVEQITPDVVVLDRSVGLEAIREITRLSPQTRVLALSNYADEAYAIEALRAGAHGYFWKDAGADELGEAVRTVAGGRRYLSDELSERVLDYVAGAETASESPVDPLASLTNREREVFHGVVAGLRNADIAEQLSISPRTVETHRANMMRKLGVRTQPELVRFALQRGLISAGEDY